jgi:predicted branched-subunit amino acid permease
MLPNARSEFLAGCRDIAPVLVGTVPFGFVAGVAAVGAGMTPLQGIALSFFAFSGIAQLVVAQLVAAQSPIALTLVAAFIVSLRFLMYSAALSPHVAHLPPRWRVLIAYLMTDQMFAMGTQHDVTSGERHHRHYRLLGIGLTLYAVWQASVIAGAVAGAQVPAAWSLDFVVTLTFLVLLVPALRTRADLAAAVVAGAVALLAAGLPYKLSLVVASLVGIGAGFAVEWRHRR